MQPIEKALELARPRLMDGRFRFRELIRKLHQECSRQGKGDFELSSMQLGYWNRPKDANRNIEIDVVGAG